MPRHPTSFHPARLITANLLALLGIIGGIAQASSHENTQTWRSPVPGMTIANAWEPHETYGPGHRGIDLVTDVNTTVTAVADGRVTWAGHVAGRGTITVDHGDERSTYEPVVPTVSVGDFVTAGQPLGTVAAGHRDCEPACLHLGRIRADEYLDPLERLRHGQGYRLISPEGPAPTPPVVSHVRTGIIDGPVTSEFGWRIHPITGQRSFHDGVDIGAACGTPVASLSSGTVSHVGHRGAYGLQVQVRHARDEVTSYSHLQATHVRTGQHVTAGQIVGDVGTTGLSTGCHLHLMHLVNGSPVDPLSG